MKGYTTPDHALHKLCLEKLPQDRYQPPTKNNTDHHSLPSGAIITVFTNIPLAHWLVNIPNEPRMIHTNN